MNTALQTVRRHGGCVVLARTALDELDYAFTPSTNKEFSTAYRTRRFQNGTHGAELHFSLDVQADDIIVRKTRLGAFSTTDLNEQLTNRGITTLLLAGVSTSGAVLSTVREAADMDYGLVVLAECTTDTDPSLHHFLIDRIFPRQATVATLDEIELRLAAGSAQSVPPA